MCVLDAQVHIALTHLLSRMIMPSLNMKLMSHLSLGPHDHSVFEVSMSLSGRGIKHTFLALVN